MKWLSMGIFIFVIEKMMLFFVPRQLAEKFFIPTRWIFIPIKTLEKRCEKTQHKLDITIE